MLDGILNMTLFVLNNSLVGFFLDLINVNFQRKPWTHVCHYVCKGKLLVFHSHSIWLFKVNSMYRSSFPEAFLGKCVLKLNKKFTGEHLCRSVIWIKFFCNFIKITFRDRCSPVNLLYIFRTTFPKNTSAGLLLNLITYNLLFFSNKFALSSVKVMITTSKKISTGTRYLHSSIYAWSKLKLLVI